MLGRAAIDPRTAANTPAGWWDSKVGGRAGRQDGVEVNGMPRPPWKRMAQVLLTFSHVDLVVTSRWYQKSPW